MYLLRFESGVKVRILQGFYRSAAVKPTDLLMTNVISEVEDILIQMRTCSLPRAAAIGRDNNQWKTSCLKEYPEDFCRALAAVFVKSKTPGHGLVPSPQWFTDIPTSLLAKFDLTACVGTRLIFLTVLHNRMPLALVM